MSGVVIMNEKSSLFGRGHVNCSSGFLRRAFISNKLLRTKILRLDNSKNLLVSRVKSAPRSQNHICMYVYGSLNQYQVFHFGMLLLSTS